MKSAALIIADHVAAAMTRRAASTGEKVQRMLDQERADIRSAVETKSAVDGKASAPRLRLQNLSESYRRAAGAAAEICAEITAEEARGAR